MTHKKELLTRWELLGLAARRPLSVLELPVVGVGVHHVDEDVVVSVGVEARQGKLERREHPPGGRRRDCEKIY